MILINKRKFESLLNTGETLPVSIGATDKLENFFIVRTVDNRFMLRFEGDLDYSNIKDLKFSLFELCIKNKPFPSLCFILNNDEYLSPFFVAVCNDIFKQILEISEESDYKKASLFAKVVSDWAGFFRRKKTISLAEEIGVIGELLFMKHLSKLIKPSLVLDAWTSNHKQDFSYNRKAYEIKTSTITQNSKITINGVDQLDNKHNSIFIVFIQLDKANAEHREAFSLSSLVEDVLKSFKGNFDLEEKFNDKLINEKKIVNYRDFSKLFFIKLDEYKYFGVKDNFPRIAPPLPDGILNLRYDILVAKIMEFIVEEKVILAYWKDNE